MMCVPRSDKSSPSRMADPSEMGSKPVSGESDISRAHSDFRLVDNRPQTVKKTFLEFQTMLFSHAHQFIVIIQDLFLVLRIHDRYISGC